MVLPAASKAIMFKGLRFLPVKISNESRAVSITVILANSSNSFIVDLATSSKVLTPSSPTNAVSCSLIEPESFGVATGVGATTSSITVSITSSTSSGTVSPMSSTSSTILITPFVPYLIQQLLFACQLP